MYVNNDQKVFFFENVLNEKELKILEYDFLSNKEKISYSGRKFAVDLEYAESFLKGKLQDLIKTNFKINGGNYFETTVPYRVHCDTGKDNLENNLYNIVIPIKLWTSEKYNSDYNKLVILNQNWYGDASFFVAGSTSAKDEYNKCVYDYRDVENLDQGFDHQLLDLCDHLDQSNLENLSIYQTVPWNPGSIIIFKRNSLHCSTNFKKANVNKKLGLSFFTVTDFPDPFRPAG
jgi:hypothetical protein